MKLTAVIVLFAIAFFILLFALYDAIINLRAADVIVVGITIGAWTMAACNTVCEWRE